MTALPGEGASNQGVQAGKLRKSTASASEMLGGTEAAYGAIATNFRPLAFLSPAFLACLPASLLFAFSSLCLR
jgi:hypothetical protein